MARIMVSLPDDLLKAVDIEAERCGMTRGGLLRVLAEESLQLRSTHRVQRMAQIDDLGGPVTSHEGGAAELVKANRPEDKSAFLLPERRRVARGEATGTEVLTEQRRDRLE
jgi:hypothetical protein